ACRALKGRLLRQEIYADDKSGQSGDPYSVTDHTYMLVPVQPMLDDRHAVFFTYESETLSYHYERNPQDPRIAHEITLEVDDFGNVTKSATAGYPRRAPSAGQPPLPPEQTATLITYTENSFVTKKWYELDWYRVSLPVESATYELTGLAPANPGALYTILDLANGVKNAAEIPYEATPAGNVLQKRLIQRARPLYRKNDLNGPTALADAESLGLPYENYKMAFTPGLLTTTYSSKVTAAALQPILSNYGKYQNLDNDGNWWVPSGRAFYSPDPTSPDP